MAASNPATTQLLHNSCKQENKSVTLWEIDVHPAEGQADVNGQALSAEARDLGVGSPI